MTELRKISVHDACPLPAQAPAPALTRRAAARAALGRLAARCPWARLRAEMDATGIEEPFWPTFGMTLAAIALWAAAWALLP